METSQYPKKQFPSELADGLQILTFVSEADLVLVEIVALLKRVSTVFLRNCGRTELQFSKLLLFVKEDLKF